MENAEDVKIFFTHTANDGPPNAEPENLTNQQKAEARAQRDSNQQTVIVYQRLLVNIHEVCIYHRGKRYTADCTVSGTSE